MRKSAAGAGAGFVDHAEIAVQKDAAAFPVAQYSDSRRVRVLRSRVEPDYVPRFHPQILGDLCNVLVPRRNDSLTTAVRALLAVDLVLHPIGEDTERFAGLIVVPEESPEPEVLRIHAIGTAADLPQVGDHAPSILSLEREELISRRRRGNGGKGWEGVLSALLGAEEIGDRRRLIGDCRRRNPGRNGNARQSMSLYANGSVRYVQQLPAEVILMARGSKKDTDFKDGMTDGIYAAVYDEGYRPRAQRSASNGSMYAAGFARGRTLRRGARLYGKFTETIHR